MRSSQTDKKNAEKQNKVMRYLRGTQMEMKEQGRDRLVESHDGKIENTYMNTDGDDRKREEIEWQNLMMERQKTQR